MTTISRAFAEELVGKSFEHLAPLFSVSSDALAILERPKVVLYGTNSDRLPLEPFEDEFVFQLSSNTLDLVTASALPFSYGVGHAVGQVLYHQRNPTILESCWRHRMAEYLHQMSRAHNHHLMDKGKLPGFPIERREIGLIESSNLAEAILHYAGLEMHKKFGPSTPLPPNAAQLRDKRDVPEPTGEIVADFALRYVGRDIAEKLRRDHSPEVFTRLIDLPLEDALDQIASLTGRNLFELGYPPKKGRGK